MRPPRLAHKTTGEVFADRLWGLPTHNWRLLEIISSLIHTRAGCSSLSTGPVLTRIYKLASWLYAVMAEELSASQGQATSQQGDPVVSGGGVGLGAAGSVNKADALQAGNSSG